MNMIPQQKDSLLKMYVLSYSKCTNEAVYRVLQKPKPNYYCRDNNYMINKYLRGFAALIYIIMANH